MLSQSRLIGFVPARDLDRAQKFYVDVLKLEFMEHDKFALVVKAGGNMIRIVSMEAFTPATYTILGWEVSDIESATTELATAGVVFLRYPYFDQNDAGIWTAPGGTRIAWFHDPDGNVLSVSQH